MDQITITLPMTERGLWVILSAIGLAAMTWLVWLTLSEQDRKSPRNPLSLLVAFGWVLLPLWLAIFCATLWQVWGMLTGAGSILTGPGSLGAGALIAALLGAPFVIWGTVLKQRAVVLSETALFNDKINAALEGLYSRRQITRAIKVAGEEKILTEWQDDIVQRNGAIDQLEGLARERPSEVQRIANILSVYVRELSKESEPQTHPRQKWADLVDPIFGQGMNEDEALERLGLSTDDVAVEALREWAGSLRPFRTDVENAAQTLGRLQDVPGVDLGALSIDLRGAILQCFDLNSLCFANAKMGGARMEGVNLYAARMAGAELNETHLEGASLSQAQLQGAYLRNAKMEGAFAIDTQLQGAHLIHARMQGSIFVGAQLQEAHLGGAQLQEASLRHAQMQGSYLFNAQVDPFTDLQGASIGGANVRSVDLSSTAISMKQVDSAFGDGSTILPDDINRPTHWPTDELEAQMFDTEYRKWLSNPTAYTPPQKPD